MGLDGEAVLDSFNEYLFEQTSKISLEEIEEAKRLKEEKEKDMKILSPYTVTSKDKKRLRLFAVVAIVLIVVAIFVYIFVRNSSSNDDFIDSRVSYKIGE